MQQNLFGSFFWQGNDGKDTRQILKFTREITDDFRKYCFDRKKIETMLKTNHVDDLFGYSFNFLHLAIICNNSNMVKYLLEKNASVLVKTDPSRLFYAVPQNSLHIATILGRCYILEQMLDHAKDKESIDFQIKNQEGYTVLDLAVLHQRKKCLALLLKHGASINGSIIQQNDDGSCVFDHKPITLAFLQPNLKTAQKLVEHKNFLPGDNLMPMMPVDHATTKTLEWMKIFRMLMSKGCSIDQFQRHAGNTLLDKAIEYKNFELAVFLILHGANPFLINDYFKCLIIDRVYSPRPGFGKSFITDRIAKKDEMQQRFLKARVYSLRRIMCPSGINFHCVDIIASYESGFECRLLHGHAMQKYLKKKISKKSNFWRRFFNC